MSHKSASVQLPAAKWGWSLLTPKIRFSSMIYHDFLLFFTATILILVLWRCTAVDKLRFFCLFAPKSSFLIWSHLHFCWPVLVNFACLLKRAFYMAQFSKACLCSLAVQLPATKIVFQLLRMDLFSHFISFFKKYIYIIIYNFLLAAPIWLLRFEEVCWLADHC